jgi:hypothetical protein
MTQRIEEIRLLKLMFSAEGINFSSEEGWNTFAEHVAVHNENLNNELQYNVSWDDALFSWYENIYTPINRAMNDWSVKRTFSNMASGDLYLAISDHWFYLKESSPNITADQAAYNLAYINRKDRPGLFSRIFRTSPLNNSKNPNRKKAA